MKTRVEYEEEERQAVLMALALLSIDKTGWDDMLNRIALKMDNERKPGRAEMYDTFRQIRGEVGHA